VGEVQEGVDVSVSDIESGRCWEAVVGGGGGVRGDGRMAEGDDAEGGRRRRLRRVA
jgi:hypothetical protein